MTTDTKEKIQYSTAIGLLLSGVVLTYINYFTSGTGDVSDGVLWYMGQCLIYAGSVFGIANYVNLQIEKKLGK